MSDMYCCPEKVKVEFMERWKNKKWNEKEDRDDIAFWEQQKVEYLEENPTHLGIFAEAVDEGADGMLEAEL